MDKIRRQITEILENLRSFLDGHDSIAELVKVDGNKVVIHIVGQCAECVANCIEDTIREKLPLVKVVFQQHFN